MAEAEYGRGKAGNAVMGNRMQTVSRDLGHCENLVRRKANGRF